MIKKKKKSKEGRREGGQEGAGRKKEGIMGGTATSFQEENI